VELTPLLFLKDGMTTSFCAYIWDWKNEKELDLIELSQQLPQNEKKHLEDLRSSKRRLEYLTGRILLRTILQKIFDLPYNIEIKKSKKGKPFIETGPEFNLSHSRGITFLGVSNDAPIGVDVEFQTEGRDVSGIAKYYGRSDELQYLESLGHKEQNEAFYKIWSLKESYSKAKGIGIDHSLQNIFFDLKNNKVFESNAEASYQFYHIKRGQSHFSVCCQDKKLKTSYLNKKLMSSLGSKNINCGQFTFEAL